MEDKYPSKVNTCNVFAPFVSLTLFKYFLITISIYVFLTSKHVYLDIHYKWKFKFLHSRSISTSLFQMSQHYFKIDEPNWSFLSANSKAYTNVLLSLLVSILWFLPSNKGAYFGSNCGLDVYVYTYMYCIHILNILNSPIDANIYMLSI